MVMEVNMFRSHRLDASCDQRPHYTQTVLASNRLIARTSMSIIDSSPRRHDQKR